MTPRRVRYGLAAFVLLSGAAVANMLLMQPPGGRSSASRPFRGLERLPGIDSTTLQPQPQPPRPAEQRNQDVANAERSPPAPNEAAEDGGTTRAVQRELAARGYHPGAPDGIAGVVTRGAIMAFEHDHGQPLTAMATEALLKEIVLADPAAPEPRPQSSPPVAGPHAERVIRTVQESLAKLGYPIGEIDGRPGPETMRAIRAFEASQRLEQTGRVSGALVARLAVALSGQGKLAASRP